MSKSEPLTVNGPKMRLSLFLVLQMLAWAVAGTTAWLNLKHEIRTLGMDRWTAMDDRMYMREFGYLNPSVELPEHERASKVGGSP